MLYLLFANTHDDLIRAGEIEPLSRKSLHTLRGAIAGEAVAQLLIDLLGLPLPVGKDLGLMLEIDLSIDRS